MYVTDKAEVVIDANPEEIWNYVTDPVHWTASNPEEHYGLEYDTPGNRPREGATFHQAEKVAGMFADLHGRFPYIDHPNVRGSEDGFLQIIVVLTVFAGYLFGSVVTVD